MAASDRPATTNSSDDRSLPRRLFDDRNTVVLLVAGITIVSILVRLIFLGDRIAHWDEGRVAYWIVHYIESGSFAYRRIIHGPFIQHVNRWLFPIIGANDFTMRLPVAIVGGLLPLSALLFREHLRRVETVAVALFLAFNPVLLYYSRFMRSDLLVATFMFVSFGLLVRAYDTRQFRYVVGAAAFAAFGFASKENAAVYVLTWIGAAALLADQALYRPREYDSGYELLVDEGHALYRERLGPWLATVGPFLGSLIDRGGSTGVSVQTDDDSEGGATEGERSAAVEQAGNGEMSANGTGPSSESGTGVRTGFVTVISPLRYVVELGVVALVFLGLLLFFYAPRGAGMAGLTYPPAPPSAGVIGFWEGFASPSNFVQMVETTWTHSVAEFGKWFTEAAESGEQSLVSQYVEFLGRYVRVMVTKAAPLTALAVFGFLIERYGSASSRNLVVFSSYCGFVSVLGYPLGTDIFGAWIVVHALVPLAIPAAVGLTRVFDWGYGAFTDDDRVGVTIAIVLLVLIAGQVAAVGISSVYIHDQSEDNYLVQYAQPGGNPREELETMAAIAAENRSGPDVLLYYGMRGNDYDENLAFVEKNLDDEPSENWDHHVMCSAWFETLPLPWYFAKDDVNVTCLRDESTLRQRLKSNPPPMVITQDADVTVPSGLLESIYDGESYEMRVYGTETTFWVREDWVNETG